MAHLFPTAELLHAEIEKTHKLTKKPFGVNLTLLPSLNPIPYDEYRKAIAETASSDRRDRRAQPVEHLPDFKNADVKVIHKLLGPPQRHRCAPRRRRDQHRRLRMRPDTRAGTT